MAESARVQSVDDIKAFRVVLIKFAEEAQTSLVSAESELHRTLQWLQGQQTIHWQDQIRKRKEAIIRCQQALRDKRLFKDSTGSYPAAQEEEKALKVAQRRLEEAEQKLAATQKYARLLQREILVYKGQVQRFMTVAQVDLPQAVAWLDRVVVKLQGYAELSPGDARLTEAMTLAEEELPPEPAGETRDIVPDAPASGGATDAVTEGATGTATDAVGPAATESGAAPSAGS